MFGAVGSAASAGSFWAFRAAISVGLPTETVAPVPPGAAGPAAWAAGSPADSAHTMPPTAAGTRNRHFLRAFIETPSKVRRLFTAVVIDGERDATKGRPRSKIRGPTERRHWIHESRGPSFRAINESYNGWPNAQGSGAIGVS